MDALLYEFVVIAILSGVVIFVCGKIKIPPVVGYLITGALFGPSGLGLVKEMEAVRNMADIGVVFLLFSIGMGISIGELIRLKKPAFVGGTIQVAGCAAVFAGIFHWWGLALNASVFLGLLLASSSTAIVLSILEQKGRTSTPSGTFCLAVLIFQDVITVPMMLSIPFLAGTATADAGALILTIGRTVGIAVVIFLLARKIVPKLLNAVVHSGSSELFHLTVLGICLGTAYLTSLFGLSLTLGAFMAGLVVAESQYSYSALEGVLPFKEVLTSVFFVSMGMLLDLGYVASHVELVLGIFLLALVVKSLVTGADVLLLGYPLRPAVVAGLALAQVGEFSFVLAKSGLEANLLQNQTYQMFLAVSILTMVVTPFLMSVSLPIANRLDRLLHGQPEPVPETAAATAPAGHIIIIGFGPAGQLCAWAAAQAKLPYVVIEMNPDTVNKYSQAGEPIHYGDAVHSSLLERYGVKKARAMIIAISDPAAPYGIAQMARRMNPDMCIITRTRFLAQIDGLKKQGANEVIAEEFETAIEMFTRLLQTYSVRNSDIGRMVRQVRARNYAAERDTVTGEQAIEELREQLPDLTIQTLAVQKGSALDGVTFPEADERVHIGFTIVAVKRGENMNAHPGADFRFQAGDVAYTVVTENDIPRVRPLFEAPPSGPCRDVK